MVGCLGDNSSRMVRASLSRKVLASKVMSSSNAARSQKQQRVETIDDALEGVRGYAAK